MRTRCLLLLLACLFLPWQRGLAATVIDSEGHAHVIDHPCSRIVSLYPAHTRNLLDLGLDREIIAVGRSDDYLADRPQIGFKDDPERLLALRPDLVLIRPMISRGYPHLVQRLSASGVQVISLQPRTMDEMFAYWQGLGRLTGREEEANGMTARFGRELAALHAQVAQIPEDRRKKVYFEAIHARMKTFAPDSIAAFVLESAGGINIATDAPVMRETNIAAYGKERLLAKAAEVDVFLAQQGRMNPIRKADIVGEPGFQAIKAVREGQVFLVEERLVARPTLELLDGMRIIFDLLYPLSADNIRERQ